LAALKAAPRKAKETASRVPILFTAEPDKKDEVRHLVEKAWQGS
jgi:hypothetical protein